MIKTIIFDIGNVLMKFDYLPYIRRLLYNEEVIDRVNGAIWRSGYWNMLDLGEDAEETMGLMLAADPEYRDAIRLTLENVGQCLIPLDYAIPWIREMKERGFQVLYLSNYSEFIMKAGPEALSFLPHMDGGIFSCHAHLVKPDPAIYQKICSDYSLVPEECVFIDDTEVNVRAAKRFGMNALLFTDYSETKKELDDFLRIRAGETGGNTCLK